MKFLDCKDGTIINLEQIVEIDTDERKVSFTNGVKVYYNPDLFERIMCEVKKYMI